MNEIITLEEAKIYLRVTDDIEDNLIQNLIIASIQVAENYTNQIYTSDGTSAIDIPEQVRTAILLQLGSLYENREDYNTKDLNRATILLLEPYRKIYEETTI